MGLTNYKNKVYILLTNVSIKMTAQGRGKSLSLQIGLFTTPCLSLDPITYQEIFDFLIKGPILGPLTFFVSKLKFLQINAVLKLSLTRPLFVYFHSFHTKMSQKH